MEYRIDRWARAEDAHVFLNKNRSTDEERACTCNTIREILCISLLILFFPCLFYPYPLLPLLFLSPYHLYFFLSAFHIVAMENCLHTALKIILYPFHCSKFIREVHSLLSYHQYSLKIGGISSIKIKPAFHPPQMNISPKFVSV